MGNTPSLGRPVGPPSPKKVLIDTTIFDPRQTEKRYVNEMVAYLTVIRGDDGASHKALYFHEWHMAFFIYSGKLCVKHMLYNDVNSKMVVINREDAVKFQIAYQAHNEACIKLDGITSVYKQYVKDTDEKL
jgi:hypothetical protein